MAPKDKPGTERHRDEAREGGPRMHGRGEKGASRVDEASPRGKGKPGIQKGADALPHGAHKKP